VGSQDRKGNKVIIYLRLMWCFRPVRTAVELLPITHTERERDRDTRTHTPREREERERDREREAGRERERIQQCRLVTADAAYASNASQCTVSGVGAGTWQHTASVVNQ
jgi:hypothetical protein